MRTFLLTLVSLCILTATQAQQDERAYFGIKAGVNMANIRSANHFTDGDLLNTKTGLAGGLFYHLGLTKAISLQPELLYSQMGSKFDDGTSATLNSAGQVDLNYLSLPILIRVSPLKWLGLYAGPQLDYFIGGKAKFDGDQADLGLSSGDAGSSQTFFAATAGLEIRLFKTVGLYGRYIYGLSDITSGEIGDAFTEGSDLYNDAIQVGLSWGFPGKPKEPMAAAPMAEPVVVDTDNDGTPDVTDQCPLIAGSAKYNGCPAPDTDGDGVNDEVDKCPALFGSPKYGGCPVPDADGDGVNDEMDKCPNQAGSAKYNGCPTPDTDGDGINDDNDRCPNQRGSAQYNGCPVPDSDGDGINDDQDKCAHYPGDASNFGCPDMTIYFANAEPTLTADDKARLDKALNVINDNPNTSLLIEGHASTVGDAAYNKKLSQQRADNIKAYFESKGVAATRMTAVGMGEENPIAGANKAEGELLSRRVVIRVTQ